VDIQERITEIEKKLDTVLHILGHGREKSDAQLEREAVGIMLKIRARDERKERRNGKA
jgi:tRNA threonylcarbamoyladenosine modification (KEOPS) complex  Pcc1 subunit